MANDKFTNAKKGSGRTSTESHARSLKRDNLFVMFVSVIVAIVIVVSLWVATSAIFEKVRLSHGIRQIIEIVSISRQVALTNRHLVEDNTQQDLLAILDRFGQIKPTGEQGGIKTLTNPWGGMLIASTVPGGYMRIETIVPLSTCQRIVGMFGDNPDTLAIEQIEVRTWKESWNQLYVKNGHDKINDNEVEASCSSTARPHVALIFNLR